MKLPRRPFLHLAAGAAALPAVPRRATGQAYPTGEFSPSRTLSRVLLIQSSSATASESSSPRRGRCRFPAPRLRSPCGFALGWPDRAFEFGHSNVRDCFRVGFSCRHEMVDDQRKPFPLREIVPEPQSLQSEIKRLAHLACLPWCYAYYFVR